MTLKYGRKQYNVKQYGRFKKTDDNETIDFKKVFKGKARIKTVGSKISSNWTTQTTPVEIDKNTNKLRLKDNLGDIVHSQTISVPGKLQKIRLMTRGEKVTSESL